jgi:membrane protease YdiL (CAAX protease family)
MKWTIACLALLAIAIVIVLVSRLPSEDAIRLVGYAATAAFAALISFLIRWRGNRAQRNKRIG